MDSRLIIRPRALPKPLLLKDYLLDDMSSCSSNGFKSFPRRQCCTSVPFLKEFDLKTTQKKYSNFNKNPPKPCLSAFQIVMTAVKSLPFSAAKLPEKKKVKNSFLPRNFSKKIFKRSGLWKRKPDQKEIGQSKCSGKLIKEHPTPLDRSYSTITAAEKKSNRWSSDFTVLEECSSGDSSSQVNLNLPKERNDAVDEPKQVVSGNRVDLTNGNISTDSTTTDGSGTANYSTNIKQKQWSSTEEKEQFSPVSVLDCPFDDEDEDEVSSPFQHRLARVEGTKKKLMKKIQMLEGLAKLEPVNLSNRFALQTYSDIESIEDKFISDLEEEDNDNEEDLEQKPEQTALKLLRHMKATLPFNGLKIKPCIDNLLLDVFTERVADSDKLCPEKIIEEAEDWIYGRKLCVDWDMQNDREAYVKEIERRGDWKRLDQENREVASELETEVFAALLNEFVLDISI